MKLQLNNDLYLHETELSATEERITCSRQNDFQSSHQAGKNVSSSQSEKKDHIIHRVSLPAPSRSSQCTRSKHLSHASNLGW